MQLNLQCLNLRTPETRDARLERDLRSLGEHRRIDAAHVRLARIPGASPAFQVHVHLVTPGPDLVADGRDHTLYAAFTKVMRQLRAELARRAGQRWRRLRAGVHTGRSGAPRLRPSPAG